MFDRIFKTAVHLAGATTLAVAIGAATAQAASPVTVSVPPLHSLVSLLLQNVDTPGLLFDSAAAKNLDQMAEADRDAIAAAKMVVWVGPTYEPNLADLRGIDPAVSLKGLTVTATVPLLGAPDRQNPDRSAGVQDMRFWLDPRLAKVAVGRIAPNLVRIYPNQADRILGNEIVLKKRLTALEHRFRKSLESLPGVPLHVPESDVLYLAWRFNLNAPNCPAAAAKSEGFHLTPGTGLYFRMMDGILGDLKRCQNGLKPTT